MRLVYLPLLEGQCQLFCDRGSVELEGEHFLVEFSVVELNSYVSINAYLLTLEPDGSFSPLHFRGRVGHKDSLLRLEDGEDGPYVAVGGEHGGRTHPDVVKKETLLLLACYRFHQPGVSIDQHVEVVQISHLAGNAHQLFSRFTISSKERNSTIDDSQVLECGSPISFQSKIGWHAKEICKLLRTARNSKSLQQEYPYWLHKIQRPHYVASD